MDGAPRPRVAALEWLDPVYVGGHWVPQMIELAGGEDVLGLPGEKSRTAEWAEVEAVAPEVVVSMPCGYYAEQAAAETMQAARAARRRSARSVFAVDAAAYFSRPGPRLVDGVELLGHLLHPELVPAPPTRRSIELDLDGLAVLRDRARPTAATPSAAQAMLRHVAAAAAAVALEQDQRGQRAADRPPMCPPIEMFGIVNVIRRLRPSHSPSPLSIRLMPRLRARRSPPRPSGRRPRRRRPRDGPCETISTPSEPQKSDTK